MNKAIGLRVIDVPFDKTKKDEFVKIISEYVFEIENKGNIAEIHYSTAISQNQYVYSAVIIERKG